MLFARDSKRRHRDRAARALYEGIVAQARLPVFYAVFNVPDTVEGRFDLIVLHAFLVMRRLGLETGPLAEEARVTSQALFDLMFADFDQNLREMGVSDLAVGRKVKGLAEAFYGRVAAYDAALAATRDDPLPPALERNLYRGAPGAPAGEAAAYVRRQAAVLDGQGAADLLAGRVVFDAPEMPA